MKGNTALGKIAYDAYCEQRHWKSRDGKPLPQFNALEAALQQAWNTGADAVRQYLQNLISLQ